jgi:hypothetical protein
MVVKAMPMMASVADCGPRGGWAGCPPLGPSRGFWSGVVAGGEGTPGAGIGMLSSHGRDRVGRKPPTTTIPPCLTCWGRFSWISTHPCRSERSRTGQNTPGAKVRPRASPGRWPGLLVRCLSRWGPAVALARRWSAGQPELRVACWIGAAARMCR